MTAEIVTSGTGAKGWRQSRGWAGLKAVRTGGAKACRDSRKPGGCAAELPKAIAATAKLVDSALDAVLPPPAGRQARVQEAMRYAVQAGGKRLRPFLVLHSARLFGVDDAPQPAGRRAPSRRCTPIQPGA